MIFCLWKMQWIDWLAHDFRVHRAVFSSAKAMPYHTIEISITTSTHLERKIPPPLGPTLPSCMMTLEHRWIKLLASCDCCLSYLVGRVQRRNQVGQTPAWTQEKSWWPEELAVRMDSNDTEAMWGSTKEMLSFFKQRLSACETRSVSVRLGCQICALLTL